MEIEVKMRMVPDQPDDIVQVARALARAVSGEFGAEHGGDVVHWDCGGVTLMAGRDGEEFYARGVGGGGGAGESACMADVRVVTGNW